MSQDGEEYRRGRGGSGARRPAGRGDGLTVFLFGLVVGLVAGVVFATASGPAGLDPASLFSEVGPFSSALASPPGARAVARAPTGQAASTTTTPQTAASQVNISLAAHRPLTIGVFGDSMADGLWAGLYRQLRDGKTYDVVRFSRPSTGISRYDYVDVQSRTAEQLAGRHVDIAVILFGTNDEQGIIQGKSVLQFNSPAWRQVYEARIEALVGLLRRQGAAVYWVGLPRMGRAGFDQRAQILNSIYAEKARQLGVPFIPTVPYTVDEHGGYDAYLAAGGKRQLMRARDGIHMTMAGYLRIATPVSGRIRNDVQVAMGRLQTASAASAQAPSSGGHR